MRVVEAAGVPLLWCSLPGPFRAVFTTRAGGVSAGAFRSLNLDERSRDEPHAVLHNRARLAAAAALAGDSEVQAEFGGAACGPGRPRPKGASAPLTLVGPSQEHGVRVVGAAEYHRYGDGSPCDGLTIHPVLDRDLGALLLFADCLPVVLVGEVDMAVVHAGWRGLLAGVIQQAARSMTGPPGAAFIGPSIGPCCYTVAGAVAGDFTHRYGPGLVQTEGGPTLRLDLWTAALRALAEVEVPADRVANPRLCTACNNDLFYSHRVEGPDTGRQGALAWAAA